MLSAPAVAIARILLSLGIAISGLAAAQAAGTVAPPQPVALPGNPMRHFLNTDALSWCRASLAHRGLAATEVGTGRVRMLAVGGPQPGYDQALSQANVCLDGLELITGTHDTFTTAKPAPGEIYYILMYRTQDECRGLIDDLRAAHHIGEPQGKDLLKVHPSFPLLRVMVTSYDASRTILEHTCVYATAVMCIDGFFQARKGLTARPPTWLREGLAADMQALICHRVACTTIAYEDKAFPMSENWNHDVQVLQKSGSSQNLPPHQLMSLGLDALPNVVYEQMYALERYVRLACGVQKAPKPSRLLQLLTALAQDTSALDAVHQVLGMNERQFTNGWVAWVAQQR